MSLIRAMFPEVARAIRSIEEPFFHSVRRSSPFAAAPISRFDFNFPRLPSVDVVETEKEYKVIAEMPGIPKENVEIHAVNGNTLEIRGSVDKSTMVPEPVSQENEAHQSESKKSHRGQHRVLSQERFSEEFFRSVSFPHTIEPEKVSAELKNGLLQVVVPKVKENMTSIPIQVK